MNIAFDQGLCPSEHYKLGWVSMFVLRRGITGFDAPGEVDFVTFKKAVYYAAGKAGASVSTSTEAVGVTPNFHEAIVLLGSCEVSVICNRALPVVAIVRHPVEVSGVEPIDVPELCEAITAYGFEVPHAVELARPIEQGDLDSLSQAELKEVKYWRPSRISQIVFNWWD